MDLSLTQSELSQTRNWHPSLVCNIQYLDLNFRHRLRKIS